MNKFLHWVVHWINSTDFDVRQRLNVDLPFHLGMFAMGQLIAMSMISGSTSYAIDLSTFPRSWSTNKTTPMKQIVDLSNATISTHDVMDSGVVTMGKMKRTARDQSVLHTFMRVFHRRIPHWFVSERRMNVNTVEQTRLTLRPMSFGVGMTPLASSAMISAAERRVVLWVTTNTAVGIKQIWAANRIPRIWLMLSTSCVALGTSSVRLSRLKGHSSIHSCPFISPLPWNSDQHDEGFVIVELTFTFLWRRMNQVSSVFVLRITTVTVASIKINVSVALWP